MKMTLQHVHVPSTDEVDSKIEERILALAPEGRIEEAQVRLERRREISPPFRATVRLVVPGPDLSSEGQGHTLQAAINQVVADLENKIRERSLKPHRKLRSNIQYSALPRIGNIH